MTHHVLTSTKDWSRASLPVGTVRIRARKARVFVRFIKVSDVGPRKDQWTEFARWWWERNRGAVPDGKRVCHADGDTLNDDPANLVLLTPGDVVFLAHDRDPAMSRRNYARCRVATAVSNRERAACRRLREWLPSLWYPVDLARRVVHIAPVRKRWQVYRAFGVTTDAGGCNGKAFESAALGWPGVRLFGACVLAVLADANGWLPTPDLVDGVRRLRAARGWGDQVLRSTLASEMSVLAAAKQVLVQRHGRLGALYHVGRAAIEARRPPCPVVPVRGSELRVKRFQGFERIDPLLQGSTDAVS